MTRIELAPEVLEDFDRILDHLQQHEVAGATARINEITAAIDVLRHSPLIGRPVRTDTRELVIGRDSRGYLVLYRYLRDLDMVFVLAIRNQNMAGYARS